MRSLPQKERRSGVNFLEKQAALGGVVTNTPIEYSVDATVKPTANLIKQYQLIPFSTLQCEAYKHHVGDLAPNAPLPPGSWVIRELNPENVLVDRASG